MKIFGYSMGDKMPPALGRHDNGLPYAGISPPPKGVDYLYVFGTEKAGICKIQVMKVFENDRDGIQTKAAMASVKRKLSSEFGERTHEIDVLVSGAPPYGALGWMMSLAQGNRWYGTIWKVDTGDISEIVLWAWGVNESRGGYIIQYRFTNYDECMTEVKAEL